MEALKYLLKEDKPLRRVCELKNKQVWISVGFGVLQEQEISIRLLAYLLPAIHLAQFLLGRGNDVLIRAYFAEQAATTVLGRSSDVVFVKSWVEKAMGLLTKFMQAFHPEIPFRVHTDMAWQGKIREVIEKLSQGPWT